MRKIRKTFDYKALLDSAVAYVDAARNTLAVQANTTVNSTYWNLGKLLSDSKLEGRHGDGIVKRLSVDLKERFPDLGTSPRNLWNMKLFFERYRDSKPKLLQAVAVLPWGHNLLLLNKRLPDEQVVYYAMETVRNGWARDFLLNAIKMDGYRLNAGKTGDNNFQATLPDVQSALANEIFRDKYNLGFLGVSKPIGELDLEKRLVEKVKTFMLELGTGFTFIGNQHRLEYNGKEYFVDLLFFNRLLRCLVAVELKIGEFKSEYVGKMNLYLSLLDKLEKGETENRSIGVILCADKDHFDVEIALQDVNKPIAVAEYELILPKDKLAQLTLE